MGYWDKGERQLFPAVETPVERIFTITCWWTFCVSRSKLKFILSFSLGWSNTIKFLLLLLLGNLSQLENQSRFDAKSWRHIVYKSRWVQWSLKKGIFKRSMATAKAFWCEIKPCQWNCFKGWWKKCLIPSAKWANTWHVDHDRDWCWRPLVPPLFHYHRLRVRSLDEQVCDLILPRLISLLQKTGCNSERTLPFPLDFFIHMDHICCKHLLLFKEKRKLRRKILM